MTFLGKVSEKLRRVIEAKGINIAFKTTNMIKENLFNGKDCDKRRYIGETGRALGLRVRGHKNQYKYSAVSQHKNGNTILKISISYTNRKRTKISYFRSIRYYKARKKHQCAPVLERTSRVVLLPNF